MKIVFYIDMMYRGGAQRVMANLTGYFCDQGYETVLINDFIQDANKPQYPISDKVKRIYLREELDGNKIIKNITRITRLRQKIKQENPDIVLSFLGRPNRRMLLATIGMKTKKVVSVRNDPNREYGKSTWAKWSVGQLFKLADGCVFQTEEAAQYFPKTVQKNSAIILNPVDNKFFSVKRSNNPKNILTVGRMEPQKNQKLLLDAFANITEEFPDEHLIICGDGPLRKELEEHVNRLGLETKVAFLGNVSYVEKELSKAKIFVLPSNYEGMPNALMEAMAAGVPCIATDCPCGGPRLLIQDNDHGILIPCDNTLALEESIRTLLNGDRKRIEISRNCSARLKKYKPEIIFQTWERYLSGLGDCNDERSN